jgi:hypothetical protein
MTFELHRIKNSLMSKESQERTHTSITTTLTIIMIKFLSNNIKFSMLISLKNFILKTLSFKVSHKLSILLRSIHDILCDILIDFAVSKTGKGKNLREKSDDIVLFITMTSRKVHIYDEIEELTTRADVCWLKRFQTSQQRERVAKDLHDRHKKKKAATVEKYRTKIRKWIFERRIWEYILTLNLFLAEKKTVVWSIEMFEKNLMNFNSTLENFVDEVIVTTILNDMMSDKEDHEMNTIITVDTITIDSSESHTITLSCIISHISIIANSQPKSFKKPKTFLGKRRKIREDDQSLHSDLQTMIILNFRAVNISEKNAQ